MRLTHGWRRVLSPSVVFLGAGICICWIVQHHGAIFTIAAQLTALPISELIIALLVTAAFTLLHELGHVAAARNIEGTRCEIVIRVRYLVPTALTRCLGLQNGSRARRCAMSGAGPIVQAGASISIVSLLPADSAFSLGAQLSLVAATLNFLPLRNLDGYWMVCEAANCQLSLTARFSRKNLSNSIYTVSMFGLLAALGSFVTSSSA